MSIRRLTSRMEGRAKPHLKKKKKKGLLALQLDPQFSKAERNALVIFLIGSSTILRILKLTKMATNSRRSMTSTCGGISMHPCSFNHGKSIHRSYGCLHIHLGMSRQKKDQPLKSRLAMVWTVKMMSNW